MAELRNCVIRIPAKDTYSTTGPSLMGRQSANEGFLKSWFQYSGHTEFWCMARYRSEAQIFASTAESVHVKSESFSPVYRWIAQKAVHRIASIGTLYLPGPQVADVSWLRRRDPIAKSTDFSIVGMTHTSCELQVQDALADMLTAPVYEWDAQICPSPSVQKMVKRLLDDEAAWLAQHLGAKKINQPQLPILPLGVDFNSFNPSHDIKKTHRDHWRAHWKLSKKDVCVLYMGRLDLRTKANLYPMLDALEIAASELKRQGKANIVLVIAGWFASDWDETVIKSAIQNDCSNLRVIIEDGRKPDVRQGVWHAADVFTSLVDNIQETFGLTPIEAMASGLPVVVSDYDGYRDSVRHGVDGYRIPTIQPAAGEGVDLIDAHADVMTSYRDYVSQASAMIGIDMAEAVQAYIRLASDPELRTNMGKQGQERAKNDYDWARLIPQYINLFDELAIIRHSASQNMTLEEWSASKSATSDSSHLASRHPRRSDPFYSFEHYPTATLHGEMTLLPGPLMLSNKNQRLTALTQQLERPVYQNVKPFLQFEFLADVLDKVAEEPGGITMQRWIVTQYDAAKKDHWLRQVGWLIKIGFLVTNNHLKL